MTETAPDTPSPSDQAALWRQRFESELEQRLRETGDTPGDLLESMRYSALAGGKRMRPLLVYGAGQALGIDVDELHGIAAAIELIHAYSLIHDDLPAMDDDDIRRGRPTNHRVYGQSTAILAGDALQALAFEVLANDANLSQNPAAQVRVIGAVAHACGAAGMAGGQVLDLAAIDKTIDATALETMHRLKTGALIRVSATAPALYALAPADQASALSDYGACVGLAFQIHDDVLDVTASSQQTGKPSQGDAARNKPAFPSVLGLERSRERASELVEKATRSLSELPGDTRALAWLAGYAIRREG
ncbi:polyprenyl synthetase family protein [Marinihelvus fidelis]|uniref:polyprenyl synthetase family protein n=1 Tax=Marinihelvus fidelis TaxID=2613842 RepID=UPI001CD7A827|nr:farnesyl diphosphate synthase [Marinihelvus fidelis]